MSTLARMRSIEECLALIKQMDEDSAITDTFLRKLVQEKKVRSIPSGVKAYVDFDNLG